MTIKNIYAFTLLEFLVVVGITIIIAGIGASVVISNTKNQLFLNVHNETIESAKLAVSMIVKEAREVNNADNGAYPIELADKLVFVFYANIDADLAVERVRYFFDATSGSLMKGITKPTGSPSTYNPGSEIITTIIPKITNTAVNPLFRYYNKDYPADTVNNPLSTPANLQSVTLVEIRVLAQSVKQTLANPVEVNSFVQLRNLKSNL